MRSIIGHLAVVLTLILSINNSTGQRIISLDESIELALKNNLEIKISDEYYMAAKSIRKASYTKFFPTIDVVGNYTRLNREFSLLQNDMLLPVIPISAIDPETGEVDPNRLFDPNISPPPTGVVFKPGSSDYYTDSEGNPVFYRYTWLPQNAMNFGVKNTYFINFGLMQPLYTGGKIRAQYNIAQYVENITDKEKRLKAAEIILETKQLFYTLFNVQKKKELAVKYSEMLDVLSVDVENYYNEGFILYDDLLKVRVKQNEAEMMLLKAENGVNLAALALKRITGLPLGENIQAHHEPEQIEIFSTIDGLVEEAINNRPEIDMAQYAVGIGESMEKIARSRYFPDIAFLANYFFANPNPYSGFASEFGHDYAFGVTMRIPIYNWNEKGHVLQAARHGLKAQELQYKDALQLVELEVTKLFYEMKEAASFVNMAESALKNAEKNLIFAESRHEEGTVTSSTLMEAQTLWQQAKTEHIEAQTNYMLAVAKLNKALGRIP